MKKGLFLDRDGVVNHDYGHVGTIPRFQFIDGLFDFLLCFQKSDWDIVIITNQAGIAKNKYSLEDFHILNNWMLSELKKKNIKIKSVYYCPYHVSGSNALYSKNSFYRKPNPGMIYKAACDHGLNLSQSILIGDKVSDMAAGLSAGIGALYLIDDKNSQKDDDYFRRIKNVRALVDIYGN